MSEPFFVMKASEANRRSRAVDQYQDLLHKVMEVIGDSTVLGKFHCTVVIDHDVYSQEVVSRVLAYLTSRELGYRARLETKGLVIYWDGPQGATP